MRLSNDIFVGLGEVISCHDYGFKVVFMYNNKANTMGIYGDLDLTWKTDPINNRRRKLYRIMTKEMKSKIAIRENWSR